MLYPPTPVPCHVCTEFFCSILRPGPDQLVQPPWTLNPIPLVCMIPSKTSLLVLSRLEAAPTPEIELRAVAAKEHKRCR